MNTMSPTAMRFCALSVRARRVAACSRAPSAREPLRMASSAPSLRRLITPRLSFTFTNAICTAGSTRRMRRI